MFELIGLAASAAATVVGYVGSRRFVRDRLRYVDAIQKGTAPVIAGVGAALLATPVVWILPLVGGGTALLLGVAVGAGTAAGARDVRSGTSYAGLLGE